jgi:hypothetical protein
MFQTPSQNPGLSVPLLPPKANPSSAAASVIQWLPTLTTPLTIRSNLAADERVLGSEAMLAIG